MKLTPKTLMQIPERSWLKTDENVRLIAYCPFRDFYGGYLVYELNGKVYKQYLSNYTAARLNIPVRRIYGLRVR